MYDSMICLFPVHKTLFKKTERLYHLVFCVFFLSTKPMKCKKFEMFFMQVFEIIFVVVRRDLKWWIYL